MKRGAGPPSSSSDRAGLRGRPRWRPPLHCDGLDRGLQPRGTDLREVSSLPAERKIIAELAEALAHAHGLGIIHRDVKPANIRLDNHDTVYLMDFGIAYLPDSGEIPTSPGTILGTPAYLAPELAEGGQMEVLPASDQYSLGAVLYETLCGQPPFFGPSSYVLFHAIHHDPPSPRTIDSRIPKSLAAICQKAMAKQPDRRYSSCQELADDSLLLALRRNTPGSPSRLGSLDSLNSLPRPGLTRNVPRSDSMPHDPSP